jgi:hypothetical protein
MIITRQKEFDDILKAIKERDIFIIGCGKCAKKLHTGGEPEVIEMEKRLTEAGMNVTGWTVLSSACTISSWEDVLSGNPTIRESDALLVMSCGGGVSVISGEAGIRVYPALDTESLGGVCRDETLIERCGLCGECTVWMYGGVCPVIRCAKGLLNGPCGGAMDRKCEVDSRDCAWDEIFEKLKETGSLELLELAKEPKDHARKYRVET